MKKTRSPVKQILAVLIVAGGLIALPYTWEPNVFLPDFRPFLPSQEQVIFGAGALILLVILYHYWFSQFMRAIEALLVVFFGFLLGTAAYIAIISLFHYSEFSSFTSFWNFVFNPAKGQASFSHIVGRVVQVFITLACGWEGLKTFIGVGRSRVGGLGIFHHRGRKLRSYEDALADAKALRAEDDNGLWWGMMKLPSRVATSHFAIVGSTGSGKTISIRLLMQSILPNIGTGKDQRALIYDAKQDMVSILAGIKPPCEVLSLIHI